MSSTARRARERRRRAEATHCHPRREARDAQVGHKIRNRVPNREQRHADDGIRQPEETPEGGQDEDDLVGESHDPDHGDGKSQEAACESAEVVAAVEGEDGDEEGEEEAKEGEGESGEEGAGFPCNMVRRVAWRTLRKMQGD